MTDQEAVAAINAARKAGRLPKWWVSDGIAFAILRTYCQQMREQFRPPPPSPIVRLQRPASV